MPGRGRQRLAGAVILSVLAHLGLLLLYDLAAHLPWMIVLLGLGFVGLAWAQLELRRAAVQWTWTIVLVAALLRSLLLPLPASLSDDIYRYVWDGKVLNAGFNPYSLPPQASELTPLRDEIWQQLPHRQIPTVYPPLALAVFGLTALGPAPVLTLKILLVAADLLTCALLLTLARRSAVAGGWTLWYAWNPLVILETAGMGHLDSLGVTAVVLTATLLSAPRRRLGMAAVVATAAVLVKLVPLLALPSWTRLSGQSRRFLLWTGALLALTLLPVLVSTGGPPPGLVKYGVSWEFNGPVFEPLWRLFEQLQLPVVVAGGLDRLKAATGEHELWNRFYPLNYSQLWAKACLAVALLVAVASAWRLGDLTAAMRRVFGSMILCSATVYPWYLMWVLPWAALGKSPGWLLLSGLLPLSYIPQFTGLPLFPWIHALIWIPFALMMLISRQWSSP